VARKLGDLPTIKMHAVRFAQYAKKADERVRREQAESAPEIEVSVEYSEEGMLPDPPGHGRDAGEEVRTVSDVRPAFGAEGPSLESVPVIAVAKEDLAWFELEADANALLAMIDGQSNVEEILASVAVPPERALGLLRDLERQNVIAFG